MFLFLSVTVFAEPQSHFELAMKFEELSSAQDKEKLINSVLPVVIQSNPEYQEHIEELRDFLVEIFTSQEYKNGKANLYKKLFTPDELTSLIKLVQEPAYLLMQKKRYEMNVGFLENMNAIIEKKMPAFEANLNQSNK